MMRRSLKLFILALSISLISCVHEFPSPHPDLVPFRLNLDFSTELPIHEEITFGADDATKLPSEFHDIRYVVNAFPVDRDGTESRVPDTSFVFTVPSTETLNRTLDFSIKEGSYVFRVWTDYVDAGSVSDKYYLTDNFSEIILPDASNHSGSNDYRDAFRGSVQTEVIDPTYYRGSALESIATEADIAMQRPLGKYKFVSTDVDLFLTRVLEAMQLQASGTKADMLSKVNLDDYNVVFRYNAFMPCSYNMFTDKPADSWTGVWYSGRLTQDNEDELSLGYDYIFVNGKETTLSVSVEVYDKDGKMMSQTNPIDVPIIRSHLTVVKGNFLTSSASGGVSISPSFDGEDYNIELKW